MRVNRSKWISRGMLYYTLLAITLVIGTLFLLQGNEDDCQEEPAKCALDLTTFVWTKTDPTFKISTFGDVGASIAYFGGFAPCETALFKYLLSDKCAANPDTTVVDIGGNIGYFTIYSAKMGCRVTTFEPTPIPSTLINISVILNNVQSKVQSYHCAIGSTETTVRMKIEAAAGFSAVNSRGTYRVAQKRLDKLIKQDVYLLKIDVEGYEDEIFKSMEELLRNYTIDNIIVEVKYNRDVKAKRNFVNQMLRMGYKVYSYQEQYAKDFFHKKWAISDCIFVQYTSPLKPDDWIMWEDLLITKTHTIPHASSADVAIGYANM